MRRFTIYILLFYCPLTIAQAGSHAEDSSEYMLHIKDDAIEEMQRNRNPASDTWRKELESEMEIVRLGAVRQKSFWD